METRTIVVPKLNILSLPSLFSPSPSNGLEINKPPRGGFIEDLRYEKETSIQRNLVTASKFQRHSTSVFCKIYLRRSRYCLEFSIAWGRLKFLDDRSVCVQFSKVILFILLHEKFLQSDWLRAVVFQLNLKYLHVKITNLLRVVV